MRKLTKEQIAKIVATRMEGYASGRLKPIKRSKEHINAMCEGRRSHPSSESFRKGKREMIQRTKETKTGMFSDDAKKRAAKAKEGLPQKTPGLAKGTNHIRARDYEIRDPNGVTHKIRNMSHFVRNNHGMFLAEDVVWSKGRCRAGNGLRRLFGKWAHGTWKGWTAVSNVEVFYNEKRDLLERKGVAK